MFMYSYIYQKRAASISSASSSSSSEEQSSSTADQQYPSTAIGREPSFIPIGSRFQADIPALIGPAYMESDTSKWLGTRVWPNLETNTDHVITIGGERHDSCTCEFPGWFECVKKHVDEEKAKLRTELGPALDDWSFDQMGEGAATNWTEKEGERLKSIVRRCKGKGKGGFLARALEALRKKKRVEIVRYYFNIIVPGKIGLRCRFHKPTAEIQTDESDDDEAASSSSSSSGSSSGGLTKKRSKVVPEANKYLKGFR